jgi:hypothetical protein
VIFNLEEIDDSKIKEYQEFFKNAEMKLSEIKKDYQQLDENAKSEYDGLKKMFDLLSTTNLDELKNA